MAHCVKRGDARALIVLGALGAPFLFSVEAHADCTVTFSAGVVLDCQPMFDAQAEVDLDNSQVTVIENESVTTVPVSAVGDNTIILNGASEADTVDPSTILPGGTLLNNVFIVPGGNDTVEISGGTFDGSLVSTGGNEIINISGGTVNGVLSTNGVATINMTNGAVLGFGVEFGDGEALSIGPGGTYAITIDGGTVGTVQGGLNSDEITINDGLAQNVLSLGGDDLIEIGPDAVVSGVVNGFTGNDVLNLSGVIGEVLGGNGDDTFVIDNASISGAVFGDTATPETGTGNDQFTIANSIINGGLFAGPGDDTIDVSGSFSGDLSGGAGNDTFTLTNAQIDGSLSGDEGNNVFNLTNSTIDGDLFAGTGTMDTITATNSTVTGTVDAVEIVNLSGFIGAADFDAVGVTFNINGATELRQVGGEGFTNADLTNSTVNMIDRAADDSITVGSVFASNTTVGIDVNPITEERDLVNVTGEFTPGPEANTLLVEFLEDPLTAGERVIPIIVADSADPTGAVEVPEEIFVAQATSPSFLAALSILQNGDNFFLRVTPDDGTITNPTAPSNAVNAIDGNAVVQDVVQDTVDRAIGFGAPTAGVAITPTFGVFANGTAGSIFHDGFDVTGPGFDGTTPTFRADNVSVIGTAELDASAEFGLEDIGVRLSGFGGYARSDVDLSTFIPGVGITPFRGSAVNDAGVVGASVLGSQIVGLGNLNYGLLAAAGFFGNTDLVLANTGATGSYDTRGVVVSAKAGRNIAVSDTVRLDVRFSGTFAGFFGDPFTDSLGNEFGETRTTFGLLAFEPGVSTVVPVGDYFLQPFGRLLLQGRVGYNNEAELAANTFEFDDDSDVTIGLSVGANIQFNDVVSAGANIDVRASEDQSAILGKLGVKFTIPRG